MNRVPDCRYLPIAWLVPGIVVAGFALALYPMVWGTHIYPLTHVFFGLGFPLLVAVWFSSFLSRAWAIWFGMLATGVFHFGHELIADPVSFQPYIVDWIELFCGAFGMAIAWVVMPLLAMAVSSGNDTEV